MWLQNLIIITKVSIVLKIKKNNFAFIRRRSGRHAMCLRVTCNVCRMWLKELAQYAV